MSEIEFHEPDSLNRAIELLAKIDGARCIAGGQTLVAMLNAGLVEPAALVSLRRIRELYQVGVSGDGGLRIGAMVTHETVAESAIIGRDFPLIPATAKAIAHPPIRSFGTIGGAVAHGDPASDYPAALVAADAAIEIAGKQGRRSVAASEFFVDYLTTTLEPDEIVSAVIVPRPSAGARGHYLKFARVDGDYATLSVAAMLSLQKGVCGSIAVALGAAGPVPVRDRGAERSLVGKPLTREGIATLAEALAARSDPVDDVRGSSEYRRGLVPGLVARALAMLQT